MGLFSVSKNTKATNASNERMNAANNQLQMDLWHEQQEYDYKKWQENNAYNTPSAQVERLKAAGINPALALSSISTGESSSTAGGQSIPNTTAATFENPANEVNMKVQNLALIGKQFSDISKQYQEVRALDMQNNWQNVEKSAVVAGILKDNKLKDEAVDNAKLANQFFRDTYMAKVQQEEENATNAFKYGLNLSAQGHLLELQKDSQAYSNKRILPQQLENMKATYGNIVADSFSKVLGAKSMAALARSQISLNETQKDAIVQNIKKGIAETYGQDLANQFNDRTMKTRINQAIADATNAQLNPLWQSFGFVGDLLKAFMK